MDSSSENLQEDKLNRELFDKVYEDFMQINDQTKLCFDDVNQASEQLKNKFANALENFQSQEWYGYVSKVVGLLIEAQLPGAKVGEICKIVTDEGVEKFAEVVGFRGQISLLLSLVDGKGISQGCRVYPTGNTMQIGLSPAL